ncbi:ferritin family protein [uncultured Methanobrevibacter sp.]|uniref:ferritin-like domain-containing protein n=1 Tax=uncultured Methanobrevibacter sp. TaxID=253161 RepID=UPI0025FC0AE2|nr:ferritin family protein [uncultured Methanobrevibacter sp.]
MVKYEHEIGITKGTPVEKFVAGNFEGETNEVGIYLAMSRQASREGYGELAEVFKRLAWEEAEHAARFCEMNGIIKDTLKENIEWMMGGEKMANAEKIETAADFFRESSKDEGRHYKILEGILERYF